MRTQSQLADGSDRQMAASTDPDFLVGLGEGTSVYVAAGAASLVHHNNKFEDSYAATVPTVTAGADYRFNRLLVGLAFDYTNLDGSYDDGGGFDKNAYGPILYGTFLPFDGAFINVALGYAHQDDFNKRRATAVVTTVAGTAVFGQTFAGNASAHYATNQYTASFLAGYDYAIDNLTIGPRLGTGFAYTDTDDFTERGDTGLELSYSGINQTSVQTSLGVQATLALPTSWGLLLPQAAVAWVHEYADDSRNIQARFVEADPSTSFTFQREPPARNWANIGLGLTAVLPNGLQPFVQVATMQGNDNYVSYGGSAGVRLGY